MRAVCSSGIDAAFRDLIEFFREIALRLPQRKDAQFANLPGHKDLQD